MNIKPFSKIHEPRLRSKEGNKFNEGRVSLSLFLKEALVSKKRKKEREIERKKLEARVTVSGRQENNRCARKGARDFAVIFAET